MNSPNLTQSCTPTNTVLVFLALLLTHSSIAHADDLVLDSNAAEFFHMKSRSWPSILVDRFTHAEYLVHTEEIEYNTSDLDRHNFEYYAAYPQFLTDSTRPQLTKINAHVKRVALMESQWLEEAGDAKSTIDNNIVRTRYPFFRDTNESEEYPEKYYEQGQTYIESRGNTVKAKVLFLGYGIISISIKYLSYQSNMYNPVSTHKNATVLNFDLSSGELFRWDKLISTDNIKHAQSIINRHAISALSKKHDNSNGAVRIQDSSNLTHFYFSANKLHVLKSLEARSEYSDEWPRYSGSDDLDYSWDESESDVYTLRFSVPLDSLAAFINNQHYPVIKQALELRAHSTN